jgi:hypothetical protein
LVDALHSREFLEITPLEFWLRGKKQAALPHIMNADDIENKKTGRTSVLSLIKTKAPTGGLKQRLRNLKWKGCALYVRAQR